MKAVVILLLAVVLSSCSLPSPDQPASPNRMGRFLGQVARCGCSDISPERMLAEYPRAVAGLYSPDEVKAMHGYVDLGAYEKFDNQIELCAQACSQTCMVNGVAKPLGGTLRGDGSTCLVNERDLQLGNGLRRETRPAR
ncbi:MAG: hypothetical protein K2X44_02285 [Magnetospirillum sp.]|nr:hypothetical protein [Magnetospirillum sp.]